MSDILSQAVIGSSPIFFVLPFFVCLFVYQLYKFLGNLRMVNAKLNHATVYADQRLHRLIIFANKNIRINTGS